VLAALIHPSVFGKGLGRTVQRMLGVSWKAIVRAIKARKELEKNKQWIPKKNKTYRNHIGAAHISIMSKWLHEDPHVAKVRAATKSLAFWRGVRLSYFVGSNPLPLFLPSFYFQPAG
jgi:hypothetical protein